MFIKVLHLESICLSKTKYMIVFLTSRADEMKQNIKLLQVEKSNS